eukprot:scaffold1621_cov150-Pinguiococcus_pyrenoidosus.AAC.7
MEVFGRPPVHAHSRPHCWGDAPILVLDVAPKVPGGPQQICEVPHDEYLHVGFLVESEQHLLGGDMGHAGATVDQELVVPAFPLYSRAFHQRQPGQDPAAVDNARLLSGTPWNELVMESQQLV